MKTFAKVWSVFGILAINACGLIILLFLSIIITIIFLISLPDLINDIIEGFWDFIDAWS